MEGASSNRNYSPEIETLGIQVTSQRIYVKMLDAVFHKGKYLPCCLFIISYQTRALAMAVNGHFPL